MDVKVVKDIENLINWFLPIVTKFPRNFRYTLGTRIEEHLYSLLEHCIQAQYSLLVVLSKAGNCLNGVNAVLLFQVCFCTTAVNDGVIDLCGGCFCVAFVPPP